MIAGRCNRKSDGRYHYDGGNDDGHEEFIPLPYPASEAISHWDTIPYVLLLFSSGSCLAKNNSPQRIFTLIKGF